MSRSTKKTILNKKTATVAVLVIVLLVAAVGFLHIQSVRKDQKSSGKISSVEGDNKQDQASTSSSGSNDKKDGQNSSANSTDQPDNQKSTPTAGVSALLIKPSGQFVSNHRPGNEGLSTSEESVCNTTSGAYCNIIFTRNGVTKDLGAKKTDANGTAYWSWDIKGSTLGPGSWQVKAVATLNGKTETSVDVMALEVQP